MTSGEWLQVIAGVGLLVALFAFPVISIWLDERRKRRGGADPSAPQLIDGQPEDPQYFLTSQSVIDQPHRELGRDAWR